MFSKVNLRCPSVSGTFTERQLFEILSKFRISELVFDPFDIYYKDFDGDESAFYENSDGYDNFYLKYYFKPLSDDLAHRFWYLIHENSLLKCVSP